MLIGPPPEPKKKNLLSHGQFTMMEPGKTKVGGISTVIESPSGAKVRYAAWLSFAKTV